MTRVRRRGPLLLAAAGVAAAALLTAVLATSGEGPPSRPSGRPAQGSPGPTAGPAGQRPMTAAAVPACVPGGCPPASVTVGTSDELAAALRAAGPGSSIRLADGTYCGTFVASNSGTADQPVWLCGGRGAVLDGGGTGSGYALHLDPADNWRVVGFTLRNAQKGLMADATTGTVVQGLLVEQIGDEAIHLRSASTRNVVLQNTVRGTGLRNAKFGEGIYVGSAESNWPDHGDGGPDRSDANLVKDNAISDTTSESVDIKEGTTGGVLTGNTFDGSATRAADSWVDVKGNGWLIEANTGTQTGKDGFQTHRILDGWGSGNVFRRNRATTRGSGVDIYVHKPADTGNQVFCDNTGAGGAATSNVPCLP